MDPGCARGSRTSPGSCRLRHRSWSWRKTVFLPSFAPLEMRCAPGLFPDAQMFLRHSFSPRQTGMPKNKTRLHKTCHMHHLQMGAPSFSHPGEKPDTIAASPIAPCWMKWVEAARCPDASAFSESIPKPGTPCSRMCSGWSKRPTSCSALLSFAAIRLLNGQKRRASHARTWSAGAMPLRSRTQFNRDKLACVCSALSSSARTSLRLTTRAGRGDIGTQPKPTRLSWLRATLEARWLHDWCSFPLPYNIRNNIHGETERILADLDGRNIRKYGRCELRRIATDRPGRSSKPLLGHVGGRGWVRLSYIPADIWTLLARLEREPPSGSVYPNRYPNPCAYYISIVDVERLHAGNFGYERIKVGY